MKRNSSNDDFYFDDDDQNWSTDPADQAFWDEFWHLEGRGDTDDTYTITIKNEKTGQKQTLHHVQLRGRKRQVKVID